MSITEKTALLVKKLAESLPEDNIPSEAKTTTNTLKDGVESHHNKERGKNEEDKEKEEHNERYKKLLRDANEHQQEKDNKKHQKKKEVEKKGQFLYLMNNYSIDSRYMQILQTKIAIRRKITMRIINLLRIKSH